MSTDAQDLERQIKTIHSIARAHEVAHDRLTIVQVKDVSGSDLGATPEWRLQVVPALADPNAHLAVDAIDRLARPDRFDFFVLATVQATGTRIYTPGGVQDLGTSEGFLMAGFGAVMGGVEKMNFKRPVFNGKEV